MKTSTIATVAGVTAATGLVAYILYFDYKRRNDAEFRRKLRKEKKRVNKTLAQSGTEKSTTPSISPEELRAALEQVRLEPGPTTASEREQYFMMQVSVGEQLAVQGPERHLAAATAFYRALRVYPSPVELMVIYQKTMPEAVFKLVMELTNLDVKDRVEGYYDNFPPKSMNVAVQNRDVIDATGKTVRKKILTVTKDFEAGDVIYKENPVVTALDFDLEGKGTHCSHCLRTIEKDSAIRPESDRLFSAYCSTECQQKAKSQSQSLLFSLEPALPPEMQGENAEPQDSATREAAQAGYVEYIKKNGKIAPLLVARFIARQVANETAKMMPAGLPKPESDFPEADAGDYTLSDHIERLRYLEIVPSSEEMDLLRAVLKNALAGLEEFVTEERHATLVGKMAYNSFGVCYDGGREDRPECDLRPEDVERTRTPLGTARQVGTGFYTVSSYISHSCSPNARPSFDNGTSEMTLIAATALKKGDELTVAYVDVVQGPDEGVIECRRRRRMELARGWRFACSCSRCAEEAVGNKEATKEETDLPADESRVESVVTRVEEGKQPGDP